MADQPSGRGTPAPSRGDDVRYEATERKILEAAHECFRTLGVGKTTLDTVARMAAVSRGTVYRYFADREALVDATIEHRSRTYYTRAAEAMASRLTLAAQMGAFGEVVSRNVADVRSNRLVEGDERLLRLSATDPEGALRRMSDFLLPYLQAAKDRGEVPAEVDDSEATEYLSRLLMSITTAPVSAGFDIRRPATVGAFMERYAVSGLLAT